MYESDELETERKEEAVVSQDSSPTRSASFPPKSKNLRSKILNFCFRFPIMPSLTVFAPWAIFATEPVLQSDDGREQKFYAAMDLPSTFPLRWIIKCHVSNAAKKFVQYVDRTSQLKIKFHPVHSL